MPSPRTLLRRYRGSLLFLVAPTVLAVLAVREAGPPAQGSHAPSGAAAASRSVDVAPMDAEIAQLVADARSGARPGAR